MFANSQMGGMSFAFPDVCKTPIPPVGPVPIPYPNMSLGMTKVPPSFKVFFGGTPAHNMNTTGTISNGDNAGVAGGVASQMVMGPDRHMLGSFGVLLEGMPATKMTGMTGANGMSMNVPGMTLVPSQFKVLILK
jgi:hypothetical protein